MRPDKGTTFHAHSIPLKVQLNSGANEGKVSSCGKDKMYISCNEMKINSANLRKQKSYCLFHSLNKNKALLRGTHAKNGVKEYATVIGRETNKTSR